jgi:hypothetical protein
MHTIASRGHILDLDVGLKRAASAPATDRTILMGATLRW